MKHILYAALALCAALAGCGGGGGGSSSPADTSPVIRFIGTFDTACTTCTPARDNTLTIAPNTGATTLGSRDIAKVELTVDRGPVQTLTAPNATSTTGLANWVFRFPQTTPIVTNIAHTCSPALSLEITVTDVGGFAFRKYISSCQFEVFGAFSDYGDKTATIKASANLPTLATFRRSGAGGYVDGADKAIGGSTLTWALKARAGDPVSAGGMSDPNLPSGAVVSVSLEGDGGALAASSVVKNAGPMADAFLLCCGPGASTASTPSTGTRTMAFVVAPARYNVPVTVPDPFNVYYRVFDPATGTVISEFRGTGAGYTAWPVAVKAGYELKLEASPVVAGTYVQLYVSTGIGGGLDSPSTANALGMAQSNRTDVPARVTVFTP